MSKRKPSASSGTVRSSANAETIRDRVLPGSQLKGAANLLVMPNLDTASAAYNIVKAVTGAITIGPVLIGPARSAHIVNSSVTSRGIVNMSAVACLRALDSGRSEG